MDDDKPFDESRGSPRPIDPAHVTKPIQLLAAWLAGLLAINASFLGAAALIHEPRWASGALVIAAIACVPGFLCCLFLLQTRFRPEMQEDSYYSRHLERKYSSQAQKITVVGDQGTDAITDGTTSPTIGGSPRATPSRFLSVNDLLPTFREIIERWEELGIRPSDTFGSTSTGGDIPRRFVVSVGMDTPTIFARRIIETVRGLGLDGVGVGEEDADRSRIYVGAYGYERGSNYLPVDTADYAKLMSDQTTDRTFFRLLRRYEHAGADDTG